MRIDELLNWARNELETKGDKQNRDSAKIDADLLLCHTLNKDRVYLFSHNDTDVNDPDLRSFKELISDRVNGTPIAHILGHREFWSLPLKVTPDTLIPRPDTELLVEVALELNADSARVLDLGTGTGAIACAVASERPHWQLTATDICGKALEVAKDNAASLCLNNISFIESHWFKKLPKVLFDIILSNPPYIDASDIHLQQGDVRFEPKSALVAEKQGLSDLEEIIDSALGHLSINGFLALEHGFEQGNAVRKLFREKGYSDVETRTDLAGLDRVTMGRFK